MQVVISIHPQYVWAILHGTKRYEYRKHVWQQNADKMIIYATRPIGKIVGEARIARIIQLPPGDLWNLTCNYAGISRKEFFNYFHSARIGYAVELIDPETFDQPYDLQEMTGLSRPPQSFAYLRKGNGRSTSE